MHALHRARGLTLIEVLVASVILSVAGAASLELLSRSDSASLFARRQALASVEAERMLSDAAVLVKANKSAARQGELDAGSSAEALGGCSVAVHETREMLSIANAGAASVRVAVVRLTAEIRDPSGDALVTIERIVPVGSAEDAR